jgi:hypothetical protein
VSPPASAYTALLEAAMVPDPGERLAAVNAWLATWVEHIQGDNLTLEKALLASSENPVRFRAVEDARTFKTVVNMILDQGHPKHLLRVTDLGRQQDPRSKEWGLLSRIEMQFVRFPHPPPAVPAGSQVPGKSQLSLVPDDNA